MRISYGDLVLAAYPPSSQVAYLRHVDVERVPGHRVRVVFASDDIPNLAVVLGAQRPGKLAPGNGRQGCQRNRKIHVTILQVDVFKVGNLVNAVRHGPAIWPRAGLSLAQRSSAAASAQNQSKKDASKKRS